MKSSAYIFLFAILMAIPSLLSAQKKPKKVAETQFKVEGVCSMCKARIEEASLIKGVKMAEWDKKSKMLSVVYNTQKTDLLTIQRAIIEVGHDADSLKAAQAAYGKLPGCCQYRDGIKTH